jgi:hypothetical protein
MTTGHLFAAGLIACTLALFIQIFPAAAFAAGADVAAASRLLAFGLFLIGVGALASATGRGCGCPR